MIRNLSITPLDYALHVIRQHLDIAQAPSGTTEHQLMVRPVRRSDICHLAETVGVLVDELYPCGWVKLLTKLEVSLSRAPSAFVVVPRVFQSRPIALASEASKGSRRAKLSTFWVAPEVRRQGVGTYLLESRISAWLHASLASVSVTVRYERAGQLMPLFSTRGFRAVAMDRDRYGVGNDELVLEWRPEWLAEAGYDLEAVLRR